MAASMAHLRCCVTRICCPLALNSGGLNGLAGALLNNTPHNCIARPADVRGAEVWVKLVDAEQPAPTNPAALVLLTMTSKPTLRADFKPGEGGKTAVYMTRWVNREGEKGPWSEIQVSIRAPVRGRRRGGRGVCDGTWIEFGHVLSP